MSEWLGSKIGSRSCALYIPPPRPRLSIVPKGKDHRLGPCYPTPTHEEGQMSICLRRREFIAGLSGAAAWPLAARAQQAAMPVIGYLSLGGTLTLGAPVQSEPVSAFRKGLSEMGYVEGRNLAIEFRWAQNDYRRMQELAADLV